MKMESKSIAMLVATLLIGVVLGMVGQGMLMRQRTERVGELRRPPGFVAHMERVIEPTEAQRDTVRTLLTATASANDRIIESSRSELQRTLATLQQQLAPLLDERQNKRLAEMSRLPDPFRPPPGGPPPRDGRPPPPEGGPPPREGPPPPRGDGA